MEQNFSDPLSAAVAKRDSNVLETVRDALKYGRTALAFQPVIQAGAPQMLYFMKVLSGLLIRRDVISQRAISSHRLKITSWDDLLTAPHCSWAWQLWPSNPTFDFP
jgi:hypothetical protein